MKAKNEIKLNDGTFEEVMASDLPRIYIHEMKDNPDGSCDMIFDINKAFGELYKKTTGRKRTSKKGLRNYMLELIKKGVTEYAVEMPSKKQVEQKVL